MDSRLENWYHGGHEGFATCTDCHLPHNNFAVYYAEKGRQGAKDTYAFIAGNIPAAIRAKVHGAISKEHGSARRRYVLRDTSSIILKNYMLEMKSATSFEDGALISLLSATISQLPGCDHWQKISLSTI